MTDLLSRLEAAEEMGPELLAKVCAAVMPDMPADLAQKLYGFVVADAWESAAIALAEHVLPGWDWTLCRNYAELIGPDADIGQWYVCEGRTPCLALCMAIIEAKGASDE